MMCCNDIRISGQKVFSVIEDHHLKNFINNKDASISKCINKKKLCMVWHSCIELKVLRWMLHDQVS